MGKDEGIAEGMTETRSPAPVQDAAKEFSVQKGFLLVVVVGMSLLFFSFAGWPLWVWTT